jgi:galactonate dehydratase
MSPEIADVETYVVRNESRPLVFVRLETDEGVHGVAEATTEGKSRAVVGGVEEMREYVVGTSPFETEQLFFEGYRNEWFSNNVVNTTVLSAFDVACWDIKGKLLDRPVYDLLGGSLNGTTLRAYANGHVSYPLVPLDTDDNEAECERMADQTRDVLDAGYDAFKFDPFGRSWGRLTREELNNAMERIRAVRDVAGPDVDLLVEGHGRFTPSQAVEVAERMAEFDPTWFEEPCPPDNTDGLREVAEKSPATVATGERHLTKFDFRDLLSNTDVGVVQPDLLNAGGFTEGKKIAAMAESEHVSFAPHNPQGPISTATYAHIDASVPNFTIQESVETFGHPDWFDDLVEGPTPLVEAGELAVPDGPGLGVDLDMDVVRERSFDPDEHIPFEERAVSVWESALADYTP